LGLNLTCVLTVRCLAASFAGQLDCCKVLTDAKADIHMVRRIFPLHCMSHARSRRGSSPFAFAAPKKHPTVPTPATATDRTALT
jgi:hypothetical protein